MFPTRPVVFEGLEPRLLLSADAIAVTAIEVNEDDPQRSTVSAITVEFDRDVEAVPPQILFLANTSTGTEVDTASARVNYDAASHRATWRFPTETGETLPNGNYLGAILGEEVQARTDFALDGNRDGQTGDSHVFQFHRQAGDADGDRDTDFLDLFNFQSTFQKASIDTGFDARFDFDADGDVDFADLFGFRSVFGTALAPDPVLTAGLSRDTARSGGFNSDALTSDATMAGMLTERAAVATLEAGFNQRFVDVTGKLRADGSFTLTPADLAAIAGGTLSDGHHVLTVRAQNAAGNLLSFVDVAFVLDRAIESPRFDLAPGSDTGVAGDQQTEAARVDLVGETEAGALVTLTPGALQTLAGTAGNFQFSDVALVEGANVLTVTASDAAGNSAAFIQTLTRSSISSTATYYVSMTGSDRNPGTQLLPWRTIQHAVSTMVGGDTAIVNAGQYNEIVSTARDGAAGKPITIRASGNVVTKTFNIRHDYTTIEGFEMTAANQGHMMTITASYCQILNNTIHDTGASWGVIRMNGNDITGCLIKGNRFYSSTGPGNDLPLIIVSGRNNVVEGNEIGPAKDLDVFRIWGDGNVIRDNYIHDITFSAGSDAHMDVFQTFGVGGDGDVVARNIVFEGNRIINFEGQIGMTEHNGSAAGMRDWDIRNNVFVNVPQQANIGIPNMRFYNNTFYNVGASNELVLRTYDSLPKGESTGARIFNNIIITAANVDRYSGAISISGPWVSADYNYVANVNGFGALRGSTEAHGINGGDPRFVDVSANVFDLLSGSPAIDQGVTLTGFGEDFSGTARPQGRAWDIGAFEYRGVGG
jgi:hypothetical protein